MPQALLLKLEIFLGVSLLLSCFAWGKRILFPFQLFTTWVHECWHAGVALLLGGSHVTITLAPDGSGLTRFKIPKGRVRQSLVASAGYLGASVTGCLLFYLSSEMQNQVFHFSAHRILLALVCLIIFSLVFWIRNAFGIVSVSLMAASLGLLVYSPWRAYSKDVLIFLAVQTALNGLFDLKQLYSIKGGSDAHTLKKYFYLPAWFWASLWLGLSIGLMAFTVRAQTATQKVFLNH